MTCGCNTPAEPVPNRKLTPREHRALAMRGRKKPAPKPPGGPRERSSGTVYFSGKPTRHLLMHIWPTSGPVWEWNVDQVLKRIDQFNGRRIIGIATGGGTVDPEVVKARFAGHECEFIVKDNSHIGESVTFPEMLRQVFRSNENDLVFYCHAKGVKYRYPEISNQTVIRWAEVMYHTLLDDPQAIASSLTDKILAGSFRRKHGSHNQNWHYSGTFLWFRSIYLPDSPWAHVGRRYAGVEFWPPRVANWNDSVCIFHDDTQNLYSNGYWRASVEPELKDWEKHQDSLAVIVPCFNYGCYLAECLTSILGQSRKPSEIVVVDDSSVDDTATVVARFPVKYVRIDSRDPHEARRAGFAITRSKYVCFVDADDVLGGGYLESAMKAVQANNATIAYSDVQHFGADDSRLHHKVGNIRVMNYIHGGAICRRDALKHSGVMDKPLHNARNRYSDWWLWRHALRCGGKAVWHDGLYHYRRHDLSVSSVRDRKLATEAYKHCHDLLRPDQW